MILNPAHYKIKEQKLVSARFLETCAASPRVLSAACEPEAERERRRSTFWVGPCAEGQGGATRDCDALLWWFLRLVQVALAQSLSMERVAGHCLAMLRNSHVSSGSGWPRWPFLQVTGCAATQPCTKAVNSSPQVCDKEVVCEFDLFGASSLAAVTSAQTIL